jgi:hypothetical protein
MYPEHEWQEWKFQQVPHGFWREALNQRRFVDWAAGELGITKLEEWYDAQASDFFYKNGSSEHYVRHSACLIYFFFWLGKLPGCLCCTMGLSPDV